MLVTTSQVVAFVFARGGSKGLPGKNILPIAGIPLLGHSIRSAQSVPQVSQVFVSTDSEEIALVAEEFNATVIQRPPELATDQASEWLAWQHAIRHVNSNYGTFDCFLSLPATAPLRSSQDIQLCLDGLKPGVDAVLTMTPSNRSPWFNMVCSGDDGFLRLVNCEGGHQVVRRQDAPQCFDLTTVAYAIRPDFILSSNSFWDGSVLGVEIPPERSIDIDTPLDFAVARFLMEEWLPAQG